MRFWLCLMVAALSSGVAQACQCEALPPDEVVRGSTLAFTGTLDNVDDNGKAVFLTADNLRGIPVQRAIVSTNHPEAGADDTSCSVMFLVGQTYTVVARGTYESGYYTDACLMKAEPAVTRERFGDVSEDNLLPALRARGMKLLETHSAEYALTTFTRAADESDNAAEDVLGQGEASLQLGNSREALSFFDDVLQQNVENKQAWSGRYRALAQLGRWSELPVDGADLTGSEVQNAALTVDLKSPIFRKAWWQHVKADGRKLIKADFSGALLSHVSFVKADLRGANLSGVRGREINLSGANLHGADLRGADLSGANLRGANLNGILKDKATKLR